MEVPFIHLHCHSHYSLLDGAGKIEDLLERTKELGMPALALTDHGNLFGALEFYQAAKKEGINPIIGYEAYIASGSRTEKSAGTQKDSSSHLTLLAINHTGYKNLLKLSSIAYLEGFYFKPRIDKEILHQYNDGLICLSGCASSEISRLISEDSADSINKAREVARWYQQLFGDRYYIEIQNNGLTSQKMILAGLINLADELKIPTVATNDVHYIHQEDYEAQDILLCVNTGKLRDDPNRMRMHTDPLKPGQLIDQFYLRSGSEMRQALPGQEDAIARTIEIADRVNIELDLTKRYYPAFTPPDGLSSDDYLRQLCLDGLKQRYVNNPERCIDGQLSDEVLARLDRELSVISTMDYTAYFLVVGDIVRVAKERNISNSARGSGVGAIVCYALNITHVCPLEFNLLFERFLDECRREAPDIDLDFDKARREEILNYVVERYGKDNVAQLGIFGTMAARKSIEDVGRTLAMPLPFVSEVKNFIPKKTGIEIKEVLQKSEELNKRYENEQEVKELIKFAIKIEGLARNTGVHPCGVIIADKPLVEYVPLKLVDKDHEDRGVVAQWEGSSIELAGLLKMDLLGLLTLTVMVHAVKIIEERTGTTIDPYQLPLEDKKTYELLSRGESKGVFQFEAPHVREYLQRMKPDCFGDIIALNAMNRPGPADNIPLYIDIKHGRAKAVYAHPVLEELLSDTNGIIVYQEQIMQILNRLGNIPLGDSLTCIKAISKKKEKEISKYHNDFVAGAKANGLAKEKANEIFELILKFAGYGFNKAHSTAYAWLIYVTAYLKSNYPLEYMTALLCGDVFDKRNFSQKDSTVEHLEDCKRMGIEVIPPDVNLSEQLYSIVDGKIVFALTAIKSCGNWAADRIVQAREKGGQFKDLFDFCERVDNRACNRATIEALIKAGAFDSTGNKRSQLFQMVDAALKSGQGAAEDAAKGQGNLFGGDDEPVTVTPKGLPTIPEWTDKEKSEYEKEVLGFYLTSHPLKEFADTFEMLRSHECSEATMLPDKTQVVLAGTVRDVKIATNKKPVKGKPSTYAMFSLEDTSGSIRSIMWADAYEKFADYIRSDSIVFMRGRADRSRSAQTDSSEGNSPDGNFIVDEVFTVEDALKNLCRGWAIMIDEQHHTKDSVDMLLKILRENPGTLPVELSLRLKDGATATFCGGKTKASVTPALYRRITEFLGTDSTKVLVKKPQSGYSRRN